jgi:DNA-binding XRE family transcriptional regulator
MKNRIDNLIRAHLSLLTMLTERILKQKPMTKEIFASNLKNLRKQSGMTQEELAAKLRIKRSRIVAWEEQRAWPEVPVLLKISKFFGYIDIRSLCTKRIK